MFKKYVLLLLLIMGSLHVNAQQDTGKLFFEHLTTEDGLAHNYIFFKMKTALFGWEAIMV